MAAWITYASGRADLDDPLADRLRAARTAGDFLAIEAVFPLRLASDAGFRAALDARLVDLREGGAARLLADQR